MLSVSDVLVGCAPQAGCRCRRAAPREAARLRARQRTEALSTRDTQAAVVDDSERADPRMVALATMSGAAGPAPRGKVSLRRLHTGVPAVRWPSPAVDWADRGPERPRGAVPSSRRRGLRSTYAFSGVATPPRSLSSSESCRGPPERRECAGNSDTKDGEAVDVTGNLSPQRRCRSEAPRGDTPFELSRRTCRPFRQTSSSV